MDGRSADACVDVTEKYNSAVSITNNKGGIQKGFRIVKNMNQDLPPLYHLATIILPPEMVKS